MQADYFIQEIIKIILEKGILAISILIVGFRITKTIEKIKSNESFKNEITKIRVEKIAKFYDLFSQYEHWSNRIIIHFETGDYLNETELLEATLEHDKINKILGYELNQMRFWINDDIYFHTVGQLELLKVIKNDILIEKKSSKIKEQRANLDSLRMNIDKLLIYLRKDQKIIMKRYDRSYLYK
ncbi:MAG: hypothetical protein Q4G16_07295 [Cruoricaptor ignavus]|nr:hypothetical protein [Cruoricaptor ignavus]